jgi:hypothetical protein
VGRNSKPPCSLLPRTILHSVTTGRSFALLTVAPPRALCYLHGALSAPRFWHSPCTALSGTALSAVLQDGPV